MSTTFDLRRSKFSDHVEFQVATAGAINRGPISLSTTIDLTDAEFDDLAQQVDAIRAERAAAQAQPVGAAA